MSWFSLLSVKILICLINSLIGIGNYTIDSKIATILSPISDIFCSTGTYVKIKSDAVANNVTKPS